MIPQHSSETNEWYTPGHIIDSVYSVFEGEISLDPCTCEAANGELMADTYYTREDDGLHRPWAAESVFINPPGGKIGRSSAASIWWEKTLLERENFGHAIFLSFNLEAIRTTQGSDLPILDFPTCIFSKRLRFVSVGKYKCAPTHASCITYVPGKVDHRKKFIREFSEHGYVLKGQRQ